MDDDSQKNLSVVTDHKSSHLPALTLPQAT